MAMPYNFWLGCNIQWNPGGIAYPIPSPYIYMFIVIVGYRSFAWCCHNSTRWLVPLVPSFRPFKGRRGRRLMPMPREASITSGSSSGPSGSMLILALGPLTSRLVLLLLDLPFWLVPNKWGLTRPPQSCLPRWVRVRLLLASPPCLGRRARLRGLVSHPGAMLSPKLW